MFDIPILLLIIIIAALVFDYTNGANDCANAIATVVSTNVLSPRAAVILAGCLDLAGALLGTEVAATLGRGIVNADMVASSQILVLAALSGAVAWNVMTLRYGIPSSSSHSLIGGLIGAALAHAGFSSLNYVTIFEKIVIPIFMSPLAALIVGYTFMKLITVIFSNSPRRPMNRLFGKMQILSAALMAASHGMNDAQKTMGVITLALFIFGVIPSVEVPLWVKLACALTMSAGTMFGGWKVIRTMGHSIVKLEPVHGFAAESSSALVITTASFLGAPVSTTHTITASIFGVGSVRRVSAVHWAVAGRLITAWCITIPASAAVAYLCFWLLRLCGLH